MDEALLVRGFDEDFALENESDAVFTDDEELTEPVYMLTTIDNPFDPFTKFEEWRRFDEEKGYFTCGYLARIANTALALSDNEYTEEVNAAIDEIIKYDPFGLYFKVKKGQFRPLKPTDTPK